MAYPQRIVSLVPSLTELAWQLGAAERLAGRTRFCVEPPEMAGMVPECGGTKDPDINAITMLQPDLVIANKEENRQEDVEALRARGFRVIVTDPSSVRDAMNMVLQVGTVLGLDEAARSLYQETATALAEPPAAERRVFVPIWRKPLMAMGGDCFGSDILAQAGGQNVFGGRARYPEVTLDDVAAAAPELVLLPDEPFRFREEHIAEFAGIAPARVIDGQLLWWYGPRMPGAIGELRRIIAEGAG